MAGSLNSLRELERTQKHIDTSKIGSTTNNVDHLVRQKSVVLYLSGLYRSSWMRRLPGEDWLHCAGNRLYSVTKMGGLRLDGSTRANPAYRTRHCFL